MTGEPRSRGKTAPTRSRRERGPAPRSQRQSRPKGEARTALLYLGDAPSAGLWTKSFQRSSCARFAGPSLQRGCGRPRPGPLSSAGHPAETMDESGRRRKWLRGRASPDRQEGLPLMSSVAGLPSGGKVVASPERYRSAASTASRDYGLVAAPTDELGVRWGGDADPSPPDPRLTWPALGRHARIATVITTASIAEADPARCGRSRGPQVRFGRASPAGRRRAATGLGPGGRRSSVAIRPARKQGGQPAARPDPARPLLCPAARRIAFTVPLFDKFVQRAMGWLIRRDRIAAVS